jgi:glycosyltransferase involved in cell wall biosynthesis
MNDGPLQGIAAVSVVVTLYNYEHCIIDTLETVANQTLMPIELIIVDDASSDGGRNVVSRWLESRGKRFHGVQFLNHPTNRGLAASRNSGFSVATADWVWVQDADNPLAPRALEQCYRIAGMAEYRVAVIHPLLLTIPDGASPQVFQGEGRPWQQKIFEPANAVDAMALVRREAWRAVGGYFHVPGGWEDYDFWCSLIDGGWTGLQCPQPLACYWHHSGSMTTVTALPQVESLERLLQRRHPWLDCIGKTSGTLNG